MSGLPNGKYIIKSYVDYNPSIGVDNNDDSAVKNVITDGELTVWAIENVGGGIYKLVLEGNWYSTTRDGNVVVQTSVDPGTRWIITPTEDGNCVIKSTNANTAWSANETSPKNLVILAPLNEQVDPYQLWKFLPILED